MTPVSWQKRKGSSGNGNVSSKKPKTTANRQVDDMEIGLADPKQIIDAVMDESLGHTSPQGPSDAINQVGHQAEALIARSGLPNLGNTCYMNVIFHSMMEGPYMLHH